MGRRRRRRRRRSGLGSFVSRTIINVGQGVSKAVNTAAKAVGLKNTSSKGNTSGWGAKAGDTRGGGFVKVTDKGEINLTVTTPAEMGDKIDIDWDNTDLTKGKMLDVHIHRLAGPIPDPPGKKK